MKVKVNGQYEFQIELEKDRVLANGAEVRIDVRQLSERHSHIIHNNQSYTIEIIEENRSDKTAEVKVNGNIYHVSVEDKYDQLLRQLGLDSGHTNTIKSIKAPMPGLVLTVLVSEGATVNKGDNLLILEAMKMENMIKSPAEGLVKKISIKKGDKVEKNEILIEFS